MEQFTQTFSIENSELSLFIDRLLSLEFMQGEDGENLQLRDGDFFTKFSFHGTQEEHNEIELTLNSLNF